MMKFIVSEQFRKAWREFAVVPAATAEAAIAIARRYAQRPKDRPMKAVKQAAITKR